MNLEKANEKKNLGKVEVIERFSANALKEIVFLERKCFPKEWQYKDAEEYYKKISGRAW